MSSAPLPVVAAIPVKPFDAAKRRLADVLDDGERRQLSMRLARRTVSTVRAAGLRPLVLSADDEVTEWAGAAGIDVLLDPGSSLDQAATSARDQILEAGEAWMIVHADLPLLSPVEVRRAADYVAAGRPVLAPSSDGGTSMIAADRPVEFAYGPGSFHRHLRSVAPVNPMIVVSIGWTLDLDTPADLTAAARHRAGAWLSAPRPA